MRRVNYTADHVNRMGSMLRRHLDLPYKLICFTDNPEGIECETHPIPAPQLVKYGSCWNRLWLFSREAAVHGDQLVSLDLDTVIVDNISSLFYRDDDFTIWQSNYPGCRYCGSIWMIKSGSHPEVWDEFDSSRLVRNSLKNRYEHPDCIAAKHLIGSDQTWMALKLPHAALWDTEDGVLSYRLHARDFLPVGARLVNFHGPEDPSLPGCQKDSPWIAEHWR